MQIRIFDYHAVFCAVSVVATMPSYLLRDEDDHGPTRLVAANYRSANQRTLQDYSPIRLEMGSGAPFLPRHVVEKIFRYLHLADRANLAATCTYLQRIEQERHCHLDRKHISATYDSIQHSWDGLFGKLRLRWRQRQRRRRRRRRKD
ncbi:MAG: F-box protein [Gammaproteobacteria bacterium]|nr:F-box protein [Gammaproteobacteria bacterium]